MYNMTDKVWKQRNVTTTYKQKVFSHQLIFCANLTSELTCIDRKVPIIKESNAV